MKRKRSQLFNRIHKTWNNITIRRVGNITTQIEISQIIIRAFSCTDTFNFIVEKRNEERGFSNCCKFFQWLHTWPSSGPKRRRKEKKKIGVPRQRSKTGIHPRQWKRASPFFFLFFRELRNGVEILSSFLVVFRPVLVGEQRKSGGGISLFFKYLVYLNVCGQRRLETGFV